MTSLSDKTDLKVNGFAITKEAECRMLKRWFSLFHSTNVQFLPVSTCLWHLTLIYIQNYSLKIHITHCLPFNILNMSLNWLITLKSITPIYSLLACVLHIYYYLTYTQLSENTLRLLLYLNNLDFKAIPIIFRVFPSNISEVQ